MSHMIAILFLIFIATCRAVPGDQFRIRSLPGLAQMPNYGVYSGYITVDASHGRALFFAYAEAKNNSATAPLALWLTGGPGCSSLLAFLGENGPFRPDENLNLLEDSWSWNDNVNMIWLESPAGVGFSYSNTTSDYHVGDKRTAEDTYSFLSQFTQHYFPRYKNTPLWITGESYGGHYVPEITELIYEKNAMGHANINIQGFMVGNAWTDPPVDNAGALNTWWSRALIPQADVEAIFQACNMSDIGPLLKKEMTLKQMIETRNEFSYYGAQCMQMIQQVQQTSFSDIDIYDIYIDECHQVRQQRAANFYAKIGSPVHQLLAKPEKKRSINKPNPCINGFMNNYLNQASVQKAMHARPTQWNMCSSQVTYSYKDVLTSVIPTYMKLFSNGAKILVYSGDVDAIVPYWGSRAWVVGLNRPILQKWRSWHVKDSFGEQVGGFVEVYDTMTFATVRNAGHEVPFYQPKRAYYMFNAFMFTGTLPK